MKNPIVIISGVIIIAALAAGAIWYTNNTKSQSTGTESAVSEAVGTSGLMSMKDLLGLGESMKCTFSYSDDNGSTEGVTYVASNKIRTDYSNTTADGTIMTGSMIQDGDYMYTWQSDTKTGFKMTLDQNFDTMAENYDQDITGTESESTQSFDPNEKVDYDCERWSANQSVFTPPTDVNFMDYSAQLQQLQEKMGGSEACAVCTNLTGEAAVMCKQNLGCE